MSAARMAVSRRCTRSPVKASLHNASNEVYTPPVAVEIPHAGHSDRPCTRDFVPWRFSDACRPSAWTYSSSRRPRNLHNTRLPTYGGLFPWGLEKNGREVKVRGDGQLVFNNLGLRLSSALDGLGLAYMPDDQGSSPKSNAA